MKIYYKYLLKNLTFYFCSILTLLSIILWFILTPGLIKKVVNSGLEIKYFFILSLLTLPYIILTILPISYFITIAYTYHKLSNDKELIALETSGTSYLQLARPAIDCSIFLCIISYLFSFFFLPYSNMKFYDKLSHYKENFAQFFLEAGTFNHPMKNIVIYFDKHDNDSTLKNLFIFDGRENHNTSILAKQGQLYRSPKGTTLKLINGSYINLHNKHNLQTLYFDETNINLFPTKDTFHKVKKMEELYINELLFPSKKLPQKLRNKYIAEGHRRISWPLYNIVLSIIGTTFLLKGPYSRSGNGYKIFVASIIAIITIILNSALLSFTINYRYLSPLIYINIFITISLCTLYITGHLDKIKLVKQQ